MKKLFTLLTMLVIGISGMWGDNNPVVVTFGNSTPIEGLTTHAFDFSGGTDPSGILSDGTTYAFTTSKVGVKYWAGTAGNIEGSWTNSVALEDINTELATEAFDADYFSSGSNLKYLATGGGGSTSTLKLTFSNKEEGDRITLYASLARRDNTLTNFSASDLVGIKIQYAVIGGSGFSDTPVFSQRTGSSSDSPVTIVKITGRLSSSKTLTMRSESDKNGWQMIAYRFNYYPHVTGSVANNDKNLGTIRVTRSHSLRDVAKTLDIETQTGTNPHSVYQNATNQTFTICAGQDVKVSYNQVDGMHAYMYIDYNNDGQFSPYTIDNGIPTAGSELVSYTYYNGKNSKGESASDSDSGSSLPVFTIPSDLAQGTYRARYKLDRDFLDPYGSDASNRTDNYTIDNRGVIIDFIIKVAPKYTVTADTKLSEIPAYDSYKAICVNEDVTLTVDVDDFDLANIFGAGNIILDANAPLSDITASGSLTVNSGKTLTVTAENFDLAYISGAGNIILDANAPLSDITVSGSLTVNSGKTLTVTAENFDLTRITGEGNVVVSEKWTSSILTSPLNITYIGGAGTTDSRVSINHTGDQVTLTGAEKTYYLTGSNSDTQTTVNFDGTTVNYNNELGIGTAIYNIDNTQITTPKFITSQGGGGRPAVVNLTGNSVITVTGNSNVDTNQSSIMIGHWNGPSNVTLSGTARIVAADAQLLVGKTANTQTITLNDNSNITAKGIKVATGATGTNTLNLNGGSLNLGDAGITAYGNSMAVNVNGNTTITATDYLLLISQPITVASGKTLTIDGGESNAIVRLTGSVTNNGTIKFKNVAIEGGEARDCSTLSLPYTYENCTLVINETSVDFAEDDETITITRIPSGFTSVRLRRVDRKYVTLDVVNGTATFTDTEAKVSGPKCLYDFTFSKETLAERKIENTSVILNSGSRGSSHGLNYDTNFNSNNSYNEETGLLKAKSTPYRRMTDDNAWPDNYSVAVYANVPDIENGCLMAFGSSVYDSQKYLALLRGASSNEIKLVKGDGTNNAFEVIATMSAENATVAKHLVVFTKNESTFKVYCDGVNVATTTYDQTLGTGFQIGSVHGGIGNSGIIRISDNSVSSDVRDAVEIQSIRIFEGVLTDGQMSVLMNEFPYESKGGSYSRTISAAANLGEDDAWTTGETTAHIPTPVVDDASTYYPDVTITTSADATLTVNENATFGKTTFEGSGTLTIAANEGHSLNIGGAVIIYSNVVVKFGAMDMRTSPVTKGADAYLTFDFSDFNFNKVYTTTKYQLTGLIGQDDTHITATGLPEDDDNRTYVFEFDDNHYWLTVTVRAPQTVYAPSETTEIEDDMPVKLTADAENTNGLLIKGDILVISETGPITFSQSPGFCSLNISEGVTVTVNNNGAQIANVTGSGTLNVPAATSITVASIATGTTLTGNGNVTTTTFPTTTPTTTDWRGTVELAAGGDVGNLTTIFNAWGNANSVIKLNSVTGWFESDYTVNPTLNILSDATVNINNGYSNKEPKLTKLTGAGILQQTWNPTGTTDHKLHIATLTGFTGTLKGTHQPIVVDRIVLNRKPAVGDLLIKTSDDVTLTSLVVGWQPLSAYSWATETHDEVAGIYVTAKDYVAEKRDLANAIVLQYDGYIGEGVNKYTVSLGEDKYTSMESYNDAINAWTTVDDYVLPSVAINQPTSAFYRIKAGDKYLQDTRKSDSATQRTLTDEEGADEATGTLFYLNDNTFIGYQTGYGFGESVRLTQDTEHLNSMLFTESSELGKYTIQSQQGTCTSADDNEGYWGVDGSELSREDDAVSGACWTLEPATSVPVTFNSTALGYATFNSPVALIVPTDKVKAYVCKIEGNTIKMYYADQLKDGDNWVLPENTPVLLYNSDYTDTPTVKLTITSDTDEEYENNGFNKGTVAAETPDAGNYIYYALRKLKSGKVGFYQRADQTAALTGFRAWIAVSKASPARNFTIEFDGDSDPTGIVEALGLEDANVEIYDLNGRKLSEYRKGINIVNGKKVFK